MLIIPNSQRKQPTLILVILGFLMYLDFMYFYLKCMGVLPEYMSMHHMCGVYEESRSGLGSSTILRYHLCAGNGPWVLWKSREYS